MKKKSGRVWGPGGYGRLANVDEVYPSFLAFGLLTGNDANKSSHGKSPAGINSATSLLNRFFQTGGSSRLTRTAGAYGGAAACSVSFALVGNAHPTTALAMLAGTSGCHVAAAHERILFYSCPRIQPHSPVPDAVRVSGPRYIWTDMPEELAELAGLTELLRDPERAVAAVRPDYDRPVPDAVRVSGPRYIWTDMPEELAELAGLTELLRDPERAVAAVRPDYDRPMLQGGEAYTFSLRSDQAHLTECLALSDIYIYIFYIYI